MRRRLICVLWIAGATVPLFVTTLFLVGCCVFPFHRVLHKVMPLCDVAAGLFRAGVGEQDDQSVPVGSKEDRVKRLTAVMVNASRILVVHDGSAIAARNAATSHRSLIALGAMRCDQDIGLHALVETFRI